ncbi:ATP-dependent DNA ligase clustered with Ku protein, LigD [Limimaricola cinnabarinus LL-001]|uniref:ATP-dependent DNA ligase clustered with Ku protein, LigD n=2 Tax=Limimaricola cinnabarinus TaxID=1125964 RepID=U2Z884_9RHOB|nr:ATP-dependent DNA ligase clustered with Ku protein, LigD [Limimaricola cinnabarinus LL-001]
MMQHAADRPVALVRMPSGLDGQRFFQRHAGKGFPDAIGTVRLTEASGREADYITLPDAAALLGAGQMGTLEVHIHGARNDRLDRPDRLVFDLDPDEGLAFEEVKRAAREMGDLMRRLGLSCAPMVTGGKGVHVVVPLRRVAGWETLRGFAQAVAQGFERRAPDRYTATMSKARREGRVFIDWLRNDTAATAISPYSLRARLMAPVASRSNGRSWIGSIARTGSTWRPRRRGWMQPAPLLEASKGAPGLSERTLDALEDWLEESA